MQTLKVSDNRRYLVTEDNQPFFWLGDTAWELFHRLSREEAHDYLENRSQKGFSVIQAVILAEVDGLHTPNPYGQIPLFNDDPTTPNEAYFQHVDAILQIAEEQGLYIGLLPTWADKIRPAWAANSKVIFTHENAYIYGRYLGERYRNATNIIWVLGGDRSSDGLEEFWAQMAAGLKEGLGHPSLMTFHPMGGYSSSAWLQQADWLDFHMLQSGHNNHDNPTWEMIAHDYALLPVRPTFDGEANYEDHPVNWRPELGYFTDYDVRKQTYRSIFAGGFGITYGHQSIWQMYQEKREPVAAPLYHWRAALDRPGAFQMLHVRNLLLSRPFLTRIPDQKLLISEHAVPAKYVVATRDSEGSFAFVYLPVANQKVHLDLSSLSSSRLKIWWYNPRTGEPMLYGEIERSSSFSIRSPDNGPDWVLVIDDGERNSPPPGQY
ncbi:apiosidase-like domain-containing protein [Tengunoibacter tsumagoiensis]|uniref:DUF4038 domain-containing protein n=1 Tax=Tengunoibacter tsumagoiensis TaxID=2014871 RepID=A0A402A9Q8_9CHLR|nr:DUF4038 domain-containing protein [Tengunoibacter tsumagoiensis]GCE15914.1 hypothetical protein KTT_57730 [Tengunoibacter tsumagoiensis]